MNNPKQFRVGLLVLAGLIALFIYGFVHSRKAPRSPNWSDRKAKLARNDLELKNLAESMQAKRGSGLCDFDDDCRIAGLGAQVCKGFSRFFLYSIRDTDEASLLQMIGKFNRLMEEANDLALEIAPCGVQSPKAYCFRNRCEVK